MAVDSRVRASGAHACTAQKGAHWWASVSSLTVATCTQHCVSRSSIIVFMSMKGLTVTRSTRYPSIARIRFCCPGNDEAASLVRVPMPRSQFSQMSFQMLPMDGCDSDYCSLSSPSRESLTMPLSEAGSASSAIRFATVSGSRSSHCLSRSWPTREVSDRHEPESSRSR